MKLFVLSLGLIICAVCLYMMIRPRGLLWLVDRVFEGAWIYLAGLARLLLGAALIAAAPHVAYPLVVELFGWLFALGGLLLVTVPAGVWQRLANWAVNLPSIGIRAGATLGIGMGGFFVYAALV